MGLTLENYTAVPVRACEARLISRKKAKRTWFHDSRIRLGPLFGTEFGNAGLTRASFAHATVGGANFGDAKAIRTCWNGHASINRKSLVRQPLARLRCRTSDFRDANLAEAQDLSVDFEGADLTGACLRDCNIDKSTRLHGVECRYPETRGAIRRAEQVGGDLIVRLHAAADTDAIGVGQAFNSALHSKSLQSAGGASKPPSLPPPSPADAVLLPEAPRTPPRQDGRGLA